MSVYPLALFRGMEQNFVEIFKEDKCLSSSVEECLSNSSLPDTRNLTHNNSGIWAHEPMSPIIPVITAVYSVVFVVGLVGNCLVMYVIIRYGYCLI